jgi:hypothetical protein
VILKFKKRQSVENTKSVLKKTSISRTKDGKEKWKLNEKFWSWPLLLGKARFFA